MSRNLGSSECDHCGHKFTLGDMRDKPIEFRRYGPYPPEMGCRVECECGKVYFAFLHRTVNFWSKESLESGEWKDSALFPDTSGKFAVEKGGKAYNTGCFTIDLSYYDSYNDEESYSDEVACLCLDDAEDAEWSW